MNKTRIEWCDATVNPVIGCTFNCPYCYARTMNNRFHYIPDFSKPQFRPAQLKKLYSKNPQIIFMNSMSDIADWQQDWKDWTYQAMSDNPQHQYLFLSKRPETEPYLDDAWNGCSITRESEMHRFNDLPAFTKRFVSMEPIMEDLQPEIHNILFQQVHWVILGAETGQRKEKVVPRKEWIESIVDECDKQNLPVFMKNSLLKVMGEKSMRRVFPKGMTVLATPKSKRSPKQN